MDDIFLTMLCDAHRNATLYNPIKNNKYDINLENVKNNYPIEEKDFDKLFKITFENYKKLNKPKGSIDIDAKFWFDVCLESLINSISENKDSVEIPNGCCSNDECSIAIYYKIIIDEINKNIQ